MRNFNARTGVFLACCILAACGGDDAPASDGGALPDSARPDAAAPPDLRACAVPSDCIVVPADCCGSCGEPTRGNALAVARDKADVHKSHVCEADQGCPECAALFSDPTLLATCRDARCVLIDLLEDDASACESDAECRVRTPDCCPCGGDTTAGRLVGISDEAAYSALVCDPEQGCDDCLPSYPSEVSASCNAEGHCETEDPRIDPNYVPEERPALCELPMEAGNCFALFPSYYYDASADACLHFDYGGCGGNDNRFETIEACEETCHPGNAPQGACEVDGVRYASGTDGIDDPVSCNTCSCIDGELTACTEIACPEPCEDGMTFAKDCAQCGPGDGCEVTRFGCVASCEGTEVCEEGQCIEGVCRIVCG